MFNVKKSEATITAEGKYDAVLHAIIDLGVQERTFKGETLAPANMVKFVFEIPELRTGDDKSVVMGYKDMALSMSEKSNLFKVVSALTEKSLTSETLHDIFNSDDVKSLLGKAVVLEVAHFELAEGGGTRAYIDDVTSLDSRLPQPKAERQSFIFSLSKTDVETFKTKLTAFTRQKIMNSVGEIDTKLQKANTALLEQAEADKNTKTTDII